MREVARATSVSYTHLDVYKRQALTSGTGRASRALSSGCAWQAVRTGCAARTGRTSRTDGSGATSGPG